MPERVAIYIRWSTDEQGEGTTLEVQLEACRLFICSQGWTVRPDLVFVDEGFSGATLDRPGLTSLRQAVREGRVDCVVVYKLDRLSRTVLHTVNLVLEEWDGICTVRSAREPIDTASPTGSIFFYLLASYAEWERATIRERTMAGKVKRAQQGRNPGFGLPYGYRKGAAPGEVVAHEREGPVVRRIFREYIAGRGVHAIAAGLNAEGVRPRRARLWHGNVVDQIVANPVYTGLLRYGLTGAASKAQRRQGEKRRIAFSEPRYASVDGAFPALLSRAEFARAQRARRVRKDLAGTRARGAAFLLSGIARCRCGAALRGDGRPAEQARYYRCSAGNCSAGLMPAERVEEAVLERVRALLAPAVRDRLRETWKQEMERHMSAAREERRRLQREIARNEEFRRRLASDYEAGALPAALYAAHLERAEGAGASLRAALAEQSAFATGRIHVNDKLFSDTTGGAGAWLHLEPAERKQLLLHVVERCTAYRAARGARADSPVDGGRPIAVDLCLRQA